ncbi:MAG: helix-turn-helix domain-containing protein [Pseudomonadota bacterium]
MQVAFATSKVPVDAFRAELNAVCGSFDIDPGRTRESGWGGVATAEIAGIETALVANDMQRILRTGQNIRRDHGENCFLIMQQSGRALMLQEDRQAMMLPGDMVLIDSARPSEFVFFGDRSRQVSLHLPRQEMRERFGSAFERGLALAARDAAARAIRAVVQQGIEVADIPVSAGYLRESLFGLLGAQFHAEARGETLRDVPAPAPGGESLLDRAVARIEARFGDAEFNAAELALDLEVSQRQLQRVFQALAVTPTRYILARRLQHAREAVVRRAQGVETPRIASIAFASGFSDLSYFNRRFRDAFGCPPGDYLSALPLRP